MEKLAQVGPQHIFWVIAAACAVLLTMGLWDWRTVIVARLRVKGKAPDYVTGSGEGEPMTTATQPVAATEQEARNVIATPGNADNGALPGNVVLRARAELIARLLKSESLYVRDAQGNHKRITQTVLIELATGLKPNGRPESDYGQLRAELEPLINPQLVIAQGRPEERVISKA